LLRGAGRKLCKRDHFPGKDPIIGLVITRLSTLTNFPAAQAISQGSAASADQVEDQDDQRDHQQKMYKAAGYVETETQKPQNQNDDQNCPKHIFSIASGTAASAQIAGWMILIPTHNKQKRVATCARVLCALSFGYWAIQYASQTHQCLGSVCGALPAQLPMHWQSSQS
jgi:hypothetical protein